MRVTIFTLLACALAQGAKVDFDRDIKPILSEKCFSCHGSKVQQAGLRLDKRQNALRGGDYGAVIVQGKSADSKLIKRVLNGDGGMQMPPTGPLEKDEIASLRSWIDEGADFGRVEIKDEAPPKPVDPKLAALIKAVRSRDIAAARKHLAAVKGVDQGGSTALHHAAAFGDVETMALLLDNGADANARNDRSSTPLHWAIGEEPKVRLLLERGADINAKQADGRTPLYQATFAGNHNNIVRLLLEKGADANLSTSTLTTPLMTAAGRGDVECMKLLLAKGAKVDALNGAGGTALIAAAAGKNLEVVKLLLANGANVNAATKRKQNALQNAAQYGSLEIVELLLAKGADLNAQDDRGYSPLMYAAYAETMPANVVKLLLDKGAKTDLTGEGDTARSLAAKRGDSEVARLLGVSEEQRKRGGVASAKANSENRPIADAVSIALAGLAKQSHNFIRIGGCNSCHSQNLPSAAAALARERGIAAPANIPMMSRTMREVSAERMMDMTVANTGSMGYEMFDNGMNRVPRDEYSDATVRFLKSMQTAEGGWKTTGHRPPLTSDDFITTGMAIYAIRTFGPEAEKADTNVVLARAAAWLDKAKPGTTQERAFHLMGLKWAGGTAKAMERSARELVAMQRADGGWSQLAGMGSDAYATGEALYALSVAGGMPVKDIAYQKGVRYLLRTQASDGSWHVKTRSLWVQPYFESGYPYAHDQWISAAGTSWASMALALTVEPKTLTQRR